MYQLQMMTDYDIRLQGRNRVIHRTCKIEMSTTWHPKFFVHKRTRDCFIEKILGKNEFEPGFGHA